MTHKPGLGATRRTLPPLLGDMASLYLGLFAALSLRHLGLVDLPTYLLAALYFTPFFCFLPIVFLMLDLYDLRTMRRLQALVQGLMASFVVTFALGITYFYLAETWLNFTPKTHLLLTVLLSHAIILVWRRLWARLYDYSLTDHKVVFLGDKEHVRSLREDLARLAPDTGFSPVQWRWPGVDLVVADAKWVDEHWDDAKFMFLAAVSHNVPIVRFEDFYESLLGKVSPEYAGRPSWALEFVLPRTNSFYPHIKRAVDCAVSCALLLVLSPIFLAVSALILCVDGRPVFYKQKRVGYLCREFMIWKFRTMARTAEADGPFTSARGEDNRITFLGRLLRRFRLDELPQLWNVVLGDMALVGPRPEWIREVEVLGMVIPNYNLRYLVPPGITGWAQIYFRATNNYKDSIEKLHYDLFYLKYFSAALDLSILLKTVKRMFVKDARMPSLPAFAPRPIEAKHHWARDFNAMGKTAPKPPDKPFPWQETLASLLFLGLFRR